MNTADWDEGALIFAQQKGLIIMGDLGGTPHHDPVLGAVIMILQRELRPGAGGSAVGEADRREDEEKPFGCHGGRPLPEERRVASII